MKGKQKNTDVAHMLPSGPMTLKSTKCKVYTLEEVEAEGLTPLVTFKDKAIVPDWSEVNRGREGYADALKQLREMAFAHLAKKGREAPTKKAKPAAQETGLLDLDEYTVGRMRR